MRNAVQSFLRLIKHGIILGNLIPVVAGFFLALQPMEKGHWLDLLITLLGINFVIASATVANNIIDYDIDHKMARTAKRPLVNKDISLQTAAIFSTVFAFVGFAVLFFYVNWLTGALAFIGFIDYVIIYSIVFKRTSYLSTLAGSISGAIPPLVGYVAVTRALDWNVLFLFLIFSSWQVAHSYAIYLYRKADYQNAEIPVLPLLVPFATTQRHILIYIGIMLFSVTILVITAFNTWLLSILSIVLVAYWFYKARYPLGKLSEQEWGKVQFLNSLMIIMGLCLFILLDRALWVLELYFL